MPRAIAIETSGRIGSVALVERDTVLPEEQFQHGLKHAAEIVPTIDGLCRARGWKPRDVDHLYVSAGPGSFTGLRIGITLAKTLALATNVKLVAVPTVAVLAENAPADARHVLIVLDAKRDQVFTARFERHDDGWHESEPAHLDSLAAMIARAPKPVHLIGEGIPYHARFIPTNGSVIITPEDTWRARAAAVAKLGAAKAARADFVDPFTFTPIYIRKPEAEEKRELQEKGLA
jgi:tRNA threonylcarbamoyladenosine biosynthesis protein TsaB